MVTLRSPVQFTQKLDPLNAPRPLTVGDSLGLRLALPIADRAAADNSGPGEGTLVQANAAGALLTNCPDTVTDFETHFMFWPIGNADDHEVIYSQTVSLLAIMGYMLVAPERLTWVSPLAALLQAFDAGPIHWVSVRGTTFHFRRFDLGQDTACNVWGFY